MLPKCLSAFVQSLANCNSVCWCNIRLTRRLPLPDCLAGEPGLPPTPPLPERPSSVCRWPVDITCGQFGSACQMEATCLKSKLSERQCQADDEHFTPPSVSHDAEMLCMSETSTAVGCAMTKRHQIFEGGREHRAAEARMRYKPEGPTR